MRQHLVQRGAEAPGRLPPPTKIRRKEERTRIAPEPAGPLALEGRASQSSEFAQAVGLGRRRQGRRDGGIRSRTESIYDPRGAPRNVHCSRCLPAEYFCFPEQRAPASIRSAQRSPGHHPSTQSSSPGRRRSFPRAISRPTAVAALRRPDDDFDAARSGYPAIRTARIRRTVQPRSPVLALPVPSPRIVTPSGGRPAVPVSSRTRPTPTRPGSDVTNISVPLDICQRRPTSEGRDGPSARHRRDNLDY